jgi:hypothetical protein
MAHFAELDENNVVLRVVVVDDKDTSDAFGVEKEHIGAAFLERVLGGRWVQTSYNSKIRKRYAGKGMVYVSEADQFAAIPKPSEEHEYDPESGEWVIPGFSDRNLQVENVGEPN